MDLALNGYVIAAGNTARGYQFLNSHQLAINSYAEKRVPKWGSTSVLFCNGLPVQRDMECLDGPQIITTHQPLQILLGPRNKLLIIKQVNV